MDTPLLTLTATASGFLLVTALFALLCRRPPAKPLLPVTFSEFSPPTENHHLPPPSLGPSECATFDPVTLDHISMSELAAATRNFAPDAIVGDGSFGLVYRARLSTGAHVAVKRLSPDATHGPREFRAEVETLGRVRHPNLARLLGYCASGPDRILVYEYLDRGSLDGWLHDPSAGAGPNALPWPARLRAARGAAAGLAFLHHDCRPRIIHRDVKAGNVLLDAGGGARVADFGLARTAEASRSQVLTQAAGTMGYMPPEYSEGATAATVRGDVYSFGVVLMELATGRRPNLPVRGEAGREEMMVKWVRRMVAEGRGMEVVDEWMGGEGMVAAEVEGLLRVACRCTEEVSKKRPTMEEVVSLLNML